MADLKTILTNAHMALTDTISSDTVVWGGGFESPSGYDSTRIFLATAGQALSGFPTTGVSQTDYPLFWDTRAHDPSTCIIPLRIQGIYWNGGTILIKDSNMIPIFEHVGRTSIRTTEEMNSGSCGVIITAPLYYTITGAAGTLIVYGEVM